MTTPRDIKQYINELVLDLYPYRIMPARMRNRRLNEEIEFLAHYLEYEESNDDSVRIQPYLDYFINRLWEQFCPVARIHGDVR